MNSSFGWMGVKPISGSKLSTILLTTALGAGLTACGGSETSSGDFDTGVVSGGTGGAPTLNVVSISSDQPTSILAIGDTVTVSIESSEPILAPSVMIAGRAAATVSGGGTSWQATQVIALGDPDGSVPISINYFDVGGEAGSRVTSVTDGSGFLFNNPSPLSLSIETSDEFSGTELDASWTFQNGTGTEFGLPAGWGNNELQSYSPDQVRVENGRLIITADVVNGSGKTTNQVRSNTGVSYTSGRIRSEQVIDMSQPAGRVEVRAKVPEGQGIWPAIWMLPTQDVVDEFGIWPLSGEIDIMEGTSLGVGGKQTIQSTIHYGFPFPNNRFNFVLYEPGVNPQDDFHVYAMEWENDNENATGEIRFYFDDVHYATQTSDFWFAVQENDDGSFTELAAPAPFNRTFNMILNVAVGGNLPGNPDATTPFPQTMEVDYVRIYDCEFARVDAPCTNGVDANVRPISGVGSVSNHELVVYTGEALNQLSFNISGQEATNQLQADSFNPNGEITTNDFAAVDPTNADNSVWNWRAEGGVANTFIGSEDLSDSEVLDTGFDFTGADYSGSIIFDLYVDELAAGTNLVVKMDSTFPNVGQVTLSNLQQGQWQTVSVRLADLVASPDTCCGGSGLNLSSVTNLFVIEANTAANPADIVADIYLDNIRIVSACPIDENCELANNTKGISGELEVFSDSLGPIWVDGIAAFDQAISFNSCNNDGGTGCPSIAWRTVVAEEAARGNVLEVSYPNDAQFAGLILGLVNEGVNLSDFASGSLEFDLNVMANPSAAEFVMKVDCVDCPVDAGQREQNIGVPMMQWQSFSIPVQDMVNTAGGLDTSVVTTGLVIFPAFGSAAGVVYQLDNVRWVAGDAPVEQPVASGAVFDDVVAAEWPTKISAFDQALDFQSCNDDGGEGCPSISWALEPVDGRGDVIAVDYPATAQFAGLIVGLSSTGVDLSQFDSGNLVFDLNVTANPNNAEFRMKADCVSCPVDAGQREQSLGVPTAGWQTMTIPIADMINANGGPDEGGLNTSAVTTGLVIFPAFGSTAGVEYQIDNIRWQAN